MRIAVVGAGGVGGYFGGRLLEAGEEVVFLARGATLEALRSRGLRLDSIKGDLRIARVAAFADPAEIGAVDAVLVTVKSWQVPGVAGTLGPLLGAGTAVLPLENGLEAPDQLAAVLGREHVLGGLCALVSYIVEPGHVRHVAAEPMIALGELDDQRSERVERLHAVLTRAGIAAEIPTDIRRSMWTKFLFIAPMSGIGAVTRVPVGTWRSVPQSRALAEAAVREIVALASARGIELAPDAFERTMGRYDGLAPESTASLQRDIMQGKPSELEAQIGAVVRMAEESGTPAPVHEYLYASLLPMENAARGTKS